MNCIDKMYKEIEEINRQEELEKLNDNQKTTKNIVVDFSNRKIEEKISSRIYAKEIDISDSKWTKFSLTNDRVKEFLVFIFKKYLIISNTRFDYNAMNKFLDNLSKITSIDECSIANTIGDFISLIEFNEELTDSFFLNAYNSVFFDNQGAFVVIEGKKFSNFPRPQPINPNQVKKILKTNFDSYFEDFKNKFKDKEFVSTVNLFRSDINKNNNDNYIEVQKTLEDKFFNILSKKGVTKDEFDEYLFTRGLRVEKQGNVYFNQNELVAFNEYKKIEFKY